ncbi:MAG: PIN domain-containing protein [Thermoplasmatota archaeon]
MAGKYLDTDCLLALIKESDWLKADVEMVVQGEDRLFTSVFTNKECKLVISRESARKDMHDMEVHFNRYNVRMLPFDERVEMLSNHLLKKYEFLGIFDSIHAATSILHGLTIISTDHIFPLIDELFVKDPREIATDLIHMRN